MLKVIIVDDEQFIAQGLQALIDWNAAGYEVAAVLSDGQEALEYIKRLPVDLVITDVMMPKMIGLELLETVRRENLSNAGFVILSGYSEFSYAQKALRYGCIDYLLKPVEKQDLLSILSKYNNISQNSKMEEQYELAYQARCLSRCCSANMIPTAWIICISIWIFRAAFVTLKFPLAILRTAKMTMMRTTSVWCSVTCTKAVCKF